MNPLYRSLLAACLCLAIWATPASGAVKKVWELDVSEIFKKSKIAPQYQPVIVEEKLVVGATDGTIKSIDLATTAIENVITLPIEIYSARVYGVFTVVFHGRHKVNNSLYYCSVDIKKKTLKGVLREEGLLWKIAGLAVFEKDNSFTVFSPAVGQIVYTQPIDYGIRLPVYTPDERNVFVNTYNDLIEMELPGLGAGAFFSSKAQRTRSQDTEPILKFTKVGVVAESIIPDNLDGSTLYYHTPSGSIGVIDVANNKTIWERSYFKQAVTILGPHVVKDSLYYLVSYPRVASEDVNIGKLICLKQQNGQANWLSEDLKFQTFSPVQFRNTILATNRDGTMLRFLDLVTGAEVNAFPIEGTMAKPLVEENSIFFHTGEKIYRFDYKGLPRWLENFLERFRR